MHGIFIRHGFGINCHGIRNDEIDNLCISSFSGTVCRAVSDTLLQGFKCTVAEPVGAFIVFNRIMEVRLIIIPVDNAVNP